MGGLSDTERAVWGDFDETEVHDRISGWLDERLGSPVAEVVFRSGRIDAVWGLVLADGRRVTVKAHRAPVDLAAVEVARDAKQVLSDAAFPAPRPLAGPEDVGGTVVSAETLVTGTPPDGRDPAVRRVLAEGLVRHLTLLRAHPALVPRTGPGPSWCRYQGGPWPTSHDPIVDLGARLPGADWLDEHAARCAEQVLAHRGGSDVLVGHGDWYAGNTLLTDGVLTGVVDWELIADTEAVHAGFAAAACGASATGGGGLSTPEEVASFLHLVEEVRGRELSAAEWTTAAGAAAWLLAFDARWQLGLVHVGLDDQATVALVRERREDYLRLPR